VARWAGSRRQEGRASRLTRAAQGRPEEAGPMKSSSWFDWLGRRAGQPSGPELVFLPVHRIDPSPFQPRRTMDQAELEALAASVRQVGVLQPVVVRRRGDRYELVMGERRWRAAQAAGLAEVPALVRELEDD